MKTGYPVRNILATALLLSATLAASAQTQYSPLWHQAATAVAPKGEVVLHPAIFKNVQASEATLKARLTGASTNAAAPSAIQLPMPDGSFRSFDVWAAPVMPKGLADRYQDITTYTAVAADDPTVTAKIDYTPFGFHAMIFDHQQVIFVDPASNVADGNYIVYYKKDYPLPAGKQMHCEVSDDRPAIPASTGTPMQLNQPDLPGLAFRSNGTIRRKYRLALSCTGEYSTAVGGSNPTKASVLAKIVTSVNRINGVYERELSYTMELVANEDTLIFLSGTADPFTNNSGNALMSENQTTITQRIGDANYDIGHVFSTGAGGIAIMSTVCQNGLKARGATGSANPTGDAYDIDYVAHEIGHQFGASHTFNNNNAGFCAGNAVQAFAYEPGSGSTLMAYAGICGGGNDYVAHSDDHFHSASLMQIVSYIDDSTTCAVTTTSSNQNAQLPSFNASYSIPFRTPFELTAPQATDPTADELTYSWEERDLGDFGASLANTRVTGPLFRPFPPTTSLTRIFPQIDSLLKNRFTSNAEKLPDTNRKLAFRLVQRDIYQGFGCWNLPDDSIRLNVIHTGTPFKVTSPASGSVWQANTTGVVTWDVSNTTAAPISCAQVNIYLSVDGGYTFPYLLAANTPNDGAEPVNVPNVNSTKMRIKVKAANNVFFSISAANATVQGGVGVGQVGHDPDLTVSPVPASTNIRIGLNTPGALQGTIFNVAGQQVWNGQVQDGTTVGVSTWPKGIYFLRLTSADGSIRKSRTIAVE